MYPDEQVSALGACLLVLTSPVNGSHTYYMRPEASVNLLLIDGNHADRQYYAQRLCISSPDYAIFEAVDGRSGLRLYQSCYIDCVVCEIRLPDMSGFEVLVNLVPVARSPEVPVIMLTDVPHTSLLQAATDNGAFAALVKRSTPGDLLDQTILKAISIIKRDRKLGVPAILPKILWDDLDRSA